MPTKKKKSTKKQSTNILGKMGVISFGILSFIVTTFVPQAYGDSSKITPDQVPPFVAILAAVFDLVIIGFIVYIGVLLIF